MSESSSSSDGIEIECGGNQARLFRKKFKLGSRVAECIQYNGELYTPTRFQGLSGRRAAKNWKTSFLCNGKAIGDVMKRGELCHSNDSNCDCECSWCAHCRECSRTPTRRKKTEECDLYESPESDTCYDNSQDSSYKPGYAERYVPNKGIGSRKRQRRRTRHGENGGRKAQTVEIESEKTFVKDEDDAVKDESVNSDDKKDKDNGIYFPLYTDMSPTDLVPEWSIMSLATSQSLPIGGDNEHTEQISVLTVAALDRSPTPDRSPPPDKGGITSDRDGTPESVIKVVVQSTATESNHQVNEKEDSQTSEDPMTYDANSPKLEEKETHEVLQCEPMEREQTTETENPVVILDGDSKEESVVVNLFHAFEDFLDDCEELTVTEKCELLDRCFSEERDLDSNRGKVIMNAVLTADNIFEVYKEAYEKEMKNAVAACRIFVKGRVGLLRSQAFKREVTEPVGNLIEYILREMESRDV